MRKTYTYIIAQAIASTACILVCSCAALPVIEERKPIQVDTPVVLRIYPGFSVSCSYRVQNLQPARLSDDIERIFAGQEGVLRNQRVLQQRTMAVVNGFNEDWKYALAELEANVTALWPHASDEGYDDIVNNVLTHNQRTQYYQQKRRGRDEDWIFSRLSITEEQQRRMPAVYATKLSEIQPAYRISKALSTSTHKETDEVLGDIDRLIQSADWVIASHNSVKQEVENADRAHRDAQRQLEWLRARLSAETDPAQQIKLRKEITDHRVEADTLQNRAVTQRESMRRYRWRIQDIENSKKAIKEMKEFLLSHHEAHLRIVRSVALLDRRRSDESSHLYREIRNSIVDASNLSNRR